MELSFGNRDPTDVIIQSLKFESLSSNPSQAGFSKLWSFLGTPGRILLRKIQPRYLNCDRNSEAEFVCVTDKKTNRKEIVGVETTQASLSPLDPPRTMKIFRVFNQLFVLDTESDQWKFVNQPMLTRLIEHPEYLPRLINERPKEDPSYPLYGPNEITITVESVSSLLLAELLSLETCYQIFAILIWYIDDYAEYAFLINVLLVLNISTSIYRQRRNALKLREFAQYTIDVNLRYPGGIATITSSELKIGDIIQIKPGWRLPCDLLLLEDRVIVDESLLTGESVAVLKSKYDPSLEPSLSNICFAGTFCIQAESKTETFPYGMVIATGFRTGKGELVRALLNQKDEKNEINKDYASFIFFTFIFAIISSSLYIWLEVKKEQITGIQIILRGLELIFSVMPISIPFFLAGLREHTIRTLKKKQIMSFSNKLMEVSRTKIICFDKTGTLTENKIKLTGYLDIAKGENGPKFGDLHADFKFGKVENSKQENFQKVRQIMSTCHSLFYSGDEIKGDPMDVEMFSHSEAQLCKEDNDLVMLEGERIRVLRRIEFTAFRKRFGIVVQNENDDSIDINLKGSCGVVAELCRPESLPLDFEEVIENLSNEGIRLIAIASRKGKLSELHSEAAALESNLEFQGLLIFENEIKEETRPVLNQLRVQGVESRMISGDHTLTSVSISRKCELIDPSSSVWLADFRNKLTWEFLQPNKPIQKFEDTPVLRKRVKFETEEKRASIAMTGQAFEILSVESVWAIRSCRVFGRANPDQKARIIKAIKSAVENFESNGYYIGFVGDGANDCAALREADFGLSLGQYEASMAAPFNTPTDNISAVLPLIRVGKGYVSSVLQAFISNVYFGYFLFFVIFSVFYLGLDLPTFINLYLDFLYSLPFFTMLSNLPIARIDTPALPPSKILSVEILTCFITNILVGILSMVVTIFSITARQNFLPRSMIWGKARHFKGDHHYTHEAYLIMIVAIVNMTVTSLCIFKGHPFKKEWYRSKRVVAFLLASLFAIFYVIFNLPGTFFLRKYSRVPYWNFEELSGFLSIAVFVGLFTVFANKVVCPKIVWLVKKVLL